MRPAPAGRIPAITLARRLRIAREEAELTQAQLARQLELNPATINGYETGRSVPPRHKVIAWAHVCDVDLAWLEGPADDGPSVTPTGPNIRKPGRSSPRVRPLHRAVAAATTLAAAVVGAGGIAS